MCQGVIEPAPLARGQGRCHSEICQPLLAAGDLREALRRTDSGKTLPGAGVRGGR